MTIKNIVTGELASITTYDPLTGQITGFVPIGNSTLGSNANVSITGGAPGQVLTTDGGGNLSWSTPASSGLANGTSNVLIPLYDGPVEISVNGIANVLTVTTTGATVTGTLDATTVSLGTGNLQISNNTIQSTNDQITIDPLGDGTPAGNLLVLANMTVAGTLSYNDISNAFTDNLTWIAANGAATPLLASGGGLAVGPAGAYAQFTFDQPANAWQSTLSITAPAFTGDGTNLTNVAANTANYANFAGNITAAYNNQPNITSLGTLTELTVAGITDLGPVANVIITGGTTGQILSTDGLGDLSWIDLPSSSALSNGTSNITISLDGDIATSVNGVSNVLVVTQTAANFIGNINATNVNATGNVVVTGNVAATAFTGDGTNLTNVAANTANYAAYAGNVTLAAQANITSLGTLTGLTVDGLTDLGAVGNVTITGGANGQVLTTDGTGVLAWQDTAPTFEVVPALYFTAPTTANNQTFSNPALASYGSNTDITLFINGALVENSFYTLAGSTLTFNLPLNTGDAVDIPATGVADATIVTATDTIVSGTSNVFVYPSGDVATSVSGSGNVLVVSSGTATLAGDFLPFGNNISNLGSAANQWNALYLKGSTVYFDGVGLSAANASVLTYNSEPIITANTDQPLTTTANVTANNFIGNGAGLTGITASGVTSGTSNITIVPDANINMSVAGVANVLVVTDAGANLAGELAVTGNVTGAFIIGNGANLTFINGANVTGSVPQADSADGASIAVNLFGTAGSTPYQNGPNQTVMLAPGDANTIYTSTGTGPSWASDINITGNVAAANANFTATTTTFDLVAGNTANLGAVANVTITGGTSGQVLTTDGSNVLSWTTVSGGSADAISNGTSNVGFSGVNGRILGYSAGNIALAINGSAAGNILIGSNAGITSQGANSIAIGPNAGSNSQAASSIAIGQGAASNSQNTFSVAIGLFAGSNTQGTYSIALGYAAAQTFQGANAIAIGRNTGLASQGANSIAIGTNSGLISQGANSIAIGYVSGSENQGTNAIAIGKNTANNQGANAIAIGGVANAQSANSIVINATGANLTATNQGFYAAPVRLDSGNVTNYMYYNTSTGEVTYNTGSGIAVISSGTSNLSFSGVNGNIEGYVGGAPALELTGGSSNSVALGVNAGGSRNQAAIAIGYLAGNATQGAYGIAIGNSAAQFNQGANAIAIGDNTAASNQGANAIAIGINAARSNQSANAIAIGVNSGNIQGISAISIGANSSNNQGTGAIAIGNNATANAQAANSIAINATATTITASAAGTYIAPVRSSNTGGGMLTYVAATKEVQVGIPQLPAFANLTAIAAAVTSPVAGMMAYDTANNRPAFYNGTAWTDL